MISHIRIRASARSRLYRSQILQVNIRLKALDEIYKIYMLLYRSDLNISQIVRKTFPLFSVLYIFIISFSTSVLFSKRRISVDLVDLVKSFQTSIYLHNSASIQPRTSPPKFGCLPA